MRRSPLSVFFLLNFLNMFLFLSICQLITGWLPACTAGELKKYEQVFAGDPEAPWRIQADEVVYHQKEEQYEAWGNVVIQQYDKTLFADRVLFNIAGMKISAEGNVTLKVGEDVLKASALEMDLKAEKGVLIDGEIFLKDANFTIKGDRVEQTRPYVFSIENAMVTTCDGDTPAWRITGKKMDVTLNGYGFVKHGTLWSKNIPVFYTPLFIFPVMLDRQSGLLIPKIGLSDRKGFEFDQPLYWAINQSSDATFYNHYMSERGNKIGLEYRYVRDVRSRGTLMFDFLDDREIDDNTPQTSNKYGYDHDNWERTNSDRYWFRMKTDQALGYGFNATLDLDIVSDQDFLLEFRDGHSGYTAADDYFMDDFGRTLDSYEDPVRINQLNINKTGLFWTFNTDVRWYDDVIARRYLDENTTLQNLPRARFNTSKQPIFSSSFYWQSDSEYTYLFSEDGTRGHRLDIHPRFYLPGFSNSYFSIEPSVGVRETAWWVDSFQDHPSEAGKDSVTVRHLFEAKLDARSEVYKIYAVDSDHIDAVKHSIVPRIVYDYIPDLDQDEHPWFGGIEDDVNRVEKTNQITLGLTQYLTTRSRSYPGRVPDQSSKTVSEEDTTRMPLNTESQEEVRYGPLLRFELMQGYDINEARAGDPADYRNGKGKQPFLPLEAELELMCAGFLSILADAGWNHYDNRFTDRNIEMALSDGQGNRLNLEYRFTDDLVEFFSANIGLNLSDRIYSYADYEHNLATGETVETNLGFIYDARCWMLDMRFSDEEDDRKIEFMVTLKGLGEIGNK